MTAKDKRFKIRVYPDEYRPGERSWSAPADHQRVDTFPQFRDTRAVPDMPGSDADTSQSQAALDAMDPAGDRPDPDCLSAEERDLIAEVRALQTVPHLAIRCFLVRGDLRLAQTLYDRLFLGLGPQFMGQAGDDIR